jgi:phenylalanyl-tRNA synthetase alpha chain
VSGYLSADELHRALTIRDLTDPAAGPHAMQLMVAAVVDALTRRWNVPATVIRVPPLVSVADNYDVLGYAATDVTRESRYTRYTSPTTMLRSHTTANIPGVLRGYVNRRDPVDELITVPGLAYRRDVVDRTHVGEPHQVDLWRLRSTSDSTDDDLMIMIGTVVDAVLPGARWRTTPVTHPYTRNGRQIDVRYDSAWLELGECGLIHPDVLDRSGLDPTGWSGLALGMGLDRAVMLRKGISDIRWLRAAEPRMVAQLGDLDPWRPVSLLPPVTRDLSVVIDNGTTDELLGDAIRSALDDRLDDIESVTVLQRTPYEELPPAARQRLELLPEQENALVRVILRPIDHTLTDAEANQLRNQIYRAIHRGPVLELA